MIAVLGLWSQVGGPNVFVEAKSTDGSHETGGKMGVLYIYILFSS